MAVANLGGQHGLIEEQARHEASPSYSSNGPFGVLIPPASTQSLDLLREHGQILALRIRNAADNSSTGSKFTESSRTQQIIPPLIPYVEKTTDLSTIGPVVFPLSLDHRLITLIQYNVLRAIVINMTVLSLHDMMPEECGAVFTLYCLPPPPHEVPPALRPTLLQQTFPHPVWIGTAPDPAMRDNLIKNHERFDHDDLCCDMLGGLYEGFNDVERRGMIAWSDPWSPDGWEVSEGFARKWKYLLKGCSQLMLSTNRWRARRGEEPLTFEV